MQLEWFGQSAFALRADGRTVAIDPFGDVSSLASRGIRWDYPPIEGLEADLLLVTHEHRDHNGVDAVTGDPAIVRSTAGTHETPIGEVVAIASEHDDTAGSQRGANVMYAFTFGGVRVAHLGDLGQAALRSEQLAHLDGVELLMVPVGGYATIDAEGAAAIVDALRPRWVVPMHYRTERIGFLEPADAFLARYEDVTRAGAPRMELGAAGAGPSVLVPAAP